MKRIIKLTGVPARKRFRALVAVAVAALVAVGAALAASSRAAVAPGSSTPPTISGTPTVGSTLTADPGTWTGSTPLSFQYQWLICDGNGAFCHPISGATAQTYVVQSGDPGNTARVQVIAGNSDGSSTATSDPTAKLAASTAPVSGSLPTISGNATVGGTLTADPGTWTGATPISYQYVWLICDGNGNYCHPIAGATAQSYQVQAGDPGNEARVQVTATNSGGSAIATSDPSSKIASAPPPPAPPTGCPSVPPGQTVAVTAVNPPARLEIIQSATSGVITRETQSFSVTFNVTDSCGHPVSGAQVYATAVPYDQVSIPPQQTTDGNGNTTVIFDRLAGFPASGTQQLMVLFVRAGKPGDPLLAGISTRRLISLPVNLHG